MNLSLFIISFSLAGFSLAFYIYNHKSSKSEKKLICPLNFDCEAVIHSPYSKFWGIPIEILGLLYYGLIIISYTFLEISPSLATSTVIFILLGITIIAFMFSLYLTFIQAFNLKQWCTWCLMSVGICAFILVLALANSKFNINFLLTEHRTFILILHLIGIALGLGGTTIADVMFIKSLKNYRISKMESDIIHTLSQVIWFSLAVLILSGIGLYIPSSERLMGLPKFWAKMAIFLIIIINGSALNLFIFPKLVKISFIGGVKRLRKWAFALGSISLISWYSTFILGVLKSVPLGFFNILLIYLGVLMLGVLFSQLIEYWFRNSK